MQSSLCHSLSGWTKVKDKQSPCDKCPTKCLSLACQGDQGHVFFNPDHTSRLSPLTNCPTGQLLFVCVMSGTEGLTGLIVLTIMQDTQHSVCTLLCDI